MREPDAYEKQHACEDERASGVHERLTRTYRAVHRSQTQSNERRANARQRTTDHKQRILRTGRRRPSGRQRSDSGNARHRKHRRPRFHDAGSHVVEDTGRNKHDAERRRGSQIHGEHGIASHRATRPAKQHIAVITKKYPGIIGTETQKFEARPLLVQIFPQARRREARTTVPPSARLVCPHSVLPPSQNPTAARTPFRVDLL